MKHLVRVPHYIRYICTYAMLLSPMCAGAILFVYHCLLPINFIQLTALGTCKFLDLEVSAYLRRGAY